MFPAFRLLIVTLAACVLGSVAHSAAPANPKDQHVKGSLVAADASVQPGRALTVALRLIHDDHWHTYWRNPGTGLATSLTWELPPGWKASEILWPAPIVLRDHTGGIIGQGYDGDLLLPVVLTPPADLAPGSTVTLGASADWLMCADVCIPGGATVSLTLPVTREEPSPDAQFGRRIRDVVAELPRATPEWRLNAGRNGKTVQLTVERVSGNHEPRQLWFFSQDGLIAYEQPQAVTADGGKITVTLSIAVDAPQDATRLTGVLTSANGWLADRPLRGLAVDLPLQPANAPAAGRAASAAPAPPKAATTPATLLLAFLGGLILNLMPCVFPVLGIKILGFVNQAGHERRRVAMHGLVFTFGVLLSFWVLAGLLAVLRAGGDELGWGFQLQSAGFVYAVAVLMLVFGLNMSGVFEFGLRATAVGSDLQMKSGYGGSFFSGVLATIVATPCSAPFLAPALGAALAVSTAESFVIFSVIALGLSAPYLLLSIFPQAVKVLPRPGGWMETFKQFMAFPLYATTGYLTWVLAAQTSEDGFQAALFSFVLIAMAIWMYGRWSAPGSSPGRVRFGVASLILVGALGLWLGWPRSAVAQSGAGGPAAATIVWEPWSRETVDQLRREGRTIYVDFTARWCATCQTNKKLVFHNDDVLRYFTEHKIATLRADWTNRDPRITAELARHGRSAVPFNVIWKPGRDEPIILPELLTGSKVLQALKE